MESLSVEVGRQTCSVSPAVSKCSGTVSENVCGPGVSSKLMRSRKQMSGC